MDFTKQMPFPEKTAYIVFTCCEVGGCDQKELYWLEVPPESPQVKITAPGDVNELKGNVKVAWAISGGTQPPDSSQSSGQGYVSLVRYSHDGGQTWQGGAPRMTDRELTVDLDQLPGGERCQFQVLVASGICTGATVSPVFRVPRKPVQLYITRLLSAAR